MFYLLPGFQHSIGAYGPFFSKSGAKDYLKRYQLDGYYMVELDIPEDTKAIWSIDKGTYTDYSTVPTEGGKYVRINYPIQHSLRTTSDLSHS